MLITMENGQQVDYSIFSVLQPYGEVVSVESSFYKTPISGKIPATMVIQLENGMQLATQHFFSTDVAFGEFFITDQSMIENIVEMLPNVDMEKLTAVGVVESDGDWAVFMEFVPCFPEE